MLELWFLHWLVISKWEAPTVLLTKTREIVSNDVISYCERKDCWELDSELLGAIYKRKLAFFSSYHWSIYLQSPQKFLSGKKNTLANALRPINFITFYCCLVFLHPGKKEKKLKSDHGGRIYFLETLSVYSVCNHTCPICYSSHQTTETQLGLNWQLNINSMELSIYDSER